MSVLVRRLDERPDADAIYCGYQFVDDHNQPLPQIEARDVPPGALFQTLAEGNFLVPEAILVRRRCYAAVGPFDESLRAIEDMDMWLRITRDHTVIGCTDILTRHRVLPASMSTDPERQCVNRLKVIAKYFGAVPEDPATMAEAPRRVHGRARLTAVVEHLQCGREARARELFADMTRICPRLLLELETFYELGCGSQPKGFRGDFSTLDVHANAERLARLLDDTLRDPAVRPHLPAPPRQIRALAALAVGLLHYGKRDTAAARRAFVAAVRQDPAYLVDRRYLPQFVKSMLPADLLTALRRRRQGPMPVAG